MVYGPQKDGPSSVIWCEPAMTVKVGTVASTQKVGEVSIHVYRYNRTGNLSTREAVI